MRDCAQLYRFQLGLFEGGFVGDDVVFVVEGVKQQELVPLRATAHQSARLQRRSRKESGD